MACKEHSSEMENLAMKGKKVPWPYSMDDGNYVP